VIALVASVAVACAPQSLLYRTTRVEGGAGTFLIHLAVRTRGPACTLSGYPSLRIVGRRGPLPTRVRHGGLAVLNGKPRPVAVTSSRPAHLLVAYNDVPTGNERRCAQGVALLVNGVRVNVGTIACNRGRLLESPYLR
jgi:hypothetical protein